MSIGFVQLQGRCQAIVLCLRISYGATFRNNFGLFAKVYYLLCVQPDERALSRRYCFLADRVLNTRLLEFPLIQVEHEEECDNHHEPAQRKAHNADFNASELPFYALSQ